MAGERTVKIKFTGDTKGLDAAAHQGEQSMGRLKTSAIAFGTAAGIGLERAGAALISFGKSSIAAFKEAQESQARLEDAFQRFPNIADTNIGKLQALNSELEKKTKFDDDATAAAQAQLAQFGLTGKQIEQLTPLMQDFAAKTGQDLPSAAGTLGKALLGQGRGLKQVGIDFKDTGSTAGNFAEIMSGLNDKVGGFAEKQGKTAAGQAAILDNQFGELKETVGAKLLPVMLTLTSAGLKIVDWMSRHQAIVLPLVAALGTWAAVQWAVNIAMAANPIGAIVAGIALLVGGIIFLATKTRFFQDVWQVAWLGIKLIASNVWTWLTVTAPAALETAFKNIAHFISTPFAAAFNFIADAWNNTIGSLSWTVPGWVPFIGGKTIQAPRLPHFVQKFHEGGVVPGAPGAEVPAILRAGEVVLTAGQARDAGPLFAEIDLGEGISQVVEIKLQRHDSSVARRVLAGAGAR